MADIENHVETDGQVMSENRELTVDELAEAKRYGLVSLKCDLLDRVVDLSYLAIAAFVLARPIDGWLSHFSWLTGEHSYARLGALYCVIYLLHLIASFPLSYFAGFVVEHRFALSNQSFLAWLRKFALKNLLGVLFGLLMYLGLFWIIWNTGAWWWVIAAIVFFAISVVLGQLAPILIMPLFNKVTRIEDSAILERFKRLAEGTGLSIEGVYQLGMSEDTTKANAMLAGIGRTRRVILGDTLIDGFTPEELDVVVAHEVGHHVHKHLPKLMLFGAGMILGGLWVCSRVLIAWTGVAPSATPTSAAPLIMFALTVFTMLLEPFQNAVSRYFERQSDRYALERTGDAPAYRSAFTKLARLNKADPNPLPVEVFLFHGHPPIAERIAAAGDIR